MEPGIIWDRVAHRYGIDQRDIDWLGLRSGYEQMAMLNSALLGSPQSLDAVDPVGGRGTEGLRAQEDSEAFDLSLGVSGQNSKPPQAAALASRRPAEPATGEELYLKLDYVSLLKKAKAVVNGSVLYRRFINGTPLENDVAVWMTDFAFEAVKAHGQHVAVYLNELYAVMVDPCAKGTITVQEMREQLLAEAIQQREQSAELARLHVRPAEPDGWQPIETAPKDGTPFLVLASDDEQFVGCWKHGRCELFGAYAVIYPATHWHKLPAPPRPTRQEGS